MGCMAMQALAAGPHRLAVGRTTGVGVGVWGGVCGGGKGRGRWLWSRTRRHGYTRPAAAPAPGHTQPSWAPGTCPAPPPQQPAMPKKGGRSKSKRLTLHQKYKVQKKVKQHHQKKRKEAKANARKGIKAPKPKDPGLPSQWPFKEELVKEFAWKRAQILAEEKRKREERKARRQVRRGGELGRRPGG